MISLLTRKPNTQHRMLRQRVHRGGARGRGGERETWAAGHHSTFNLQPSSFNRGTTLTEVLMSIMILSIGIISLATLFPISVIRALQATQLTNATHLRFNAETTIDTLPKIVHNPDGDTNLVEHFGRNYIVDPLGFLRAPTVALKNSFGDDGTGNLYENALSRFVGNSLWSDGTNDEAETLQAVSLPDSWLEVVDGDVSRIDPTTFIELPTIDFDLSGVVLGPAVPFRIVLFDITGRKSHTRVIDTISIVGLNWVITWLDANAIPNPFTVSSFRIQTQEARYTWLLTVRKAASGPANVDVVVFFRRPDPPEEERVFDNVTFPTQGSDDIIAIPFPMGVDPGIKRGHYLLDLQNARWYRILDIILEDATGVTVRIDRPVLNDDEMAKFTAVVVMPSVVEVYPIGTKYQQ